MSRLSDAFDILKDEILKDPEIAYAWHCNIAMASIDEGMEDKAANRAAARFMYTCFGLTYDQYRPTQERDDV